MNRPKVGTNARPGQPLAVVVGAGGMGMAVARRLGGQYRLLLADRDGDQLEQKVAALHAEGHDVAGCVCDVTDRDAVARLADTATGIGPLRVLGHVVGLSPSMGSFRQLMDVNLIGATLVADAMLRLAEQGTAAIFVASLAPHAAPPPAALLDAASDPLAPGFLDMIEAAAGDEANSLLAYRLSKAALIDLCKRRVRDWGARGARIVSLSPGLIATPMGALEFERLPAKYDMLAATPLQREGTMVEIADAVDFLASDRASFISGIDLLVDGGLLAATRSS